MNLLKLKRKNDKMSLRYFSILRSMNIMSELNMSHGKMSDFLSLSLFVFILVITLKNFDFGGH